jgi:iron(III) transport system substrate-binding protein
MRTYKSRLRSYLAAGLVAVVLGMPVASQAAEVVNLYSYRQPFLINQFLKEFTKQTGIKVNVVFAQKGMLERLKAEGRNTPADAVLTVDIARLSAIAKADLLAPVSSPVLDKNIPAQYRHPQGLWYGLTTRARVVYASKDRVKDGEIETYADLASPRFKGKVCTRSGKHDYTLSLIAAMVAEKGEQAAEDFVRKLKANLARKPKGNDRAQVKAINEGLCDVSLGNTYYMGQMATNEKNPEQKDWANAVRIVFPTVNGTGTHVNISGAAITKHGKNKENARKLLEFLSDSFAQKMYAEQNFEYPVKAGVAWHPMVKSWGSFTPSEINLETIAKHRATATKIMDRVNFDG